jgi:pimeloyl-ACP methyl ester carboxylesterase
MPGASSGSFSASTGVGRDLPGAGPAALRLPRALLQGASRARVDPWVDTLHQPVLLVHGYAGTDAVWDPLMRALRSVGFGYLLRFSYNSFSADVAELAGEIAQLATVARARTGADGVHLVGHSLGGLLVRYAAQQDDLFSQVTTVVTIATPHRGLPVARLAPGRCARLMRPRSPLLRPTGGAAGPPRWVAFYSGEDRLVRASSARLDEPGFEATNIEIPDRGHRSICRDPRLVAAVTRELLRSELSAVSDAA